VSVVVSVPETLIVLYETVGLFLACFYVLDKKPC